MLKEKRIHVEGCPLCSIFENLDIKTKLYYPRYSDINRLDDFVIVDCLSCGVPMVVVSDHTTTIGKEQWGRILYQARRLFGTGMRLRLKRRTIKDHWHAHVENISVDIDNLPDLRDE